MEKTGHKGWSRVERQVEIVWSDTGRSEGVGGRKTKRGLYRAGADSSSLTLLYEHEGNTHTYTPTLTAIQIMTMQALRPAAACALHLLVYVLLQLKLLTGILRRPVLQLSETKAEKRRCVNKMETPPIKTENAQFLLYIALKQ